MVYLFNKKNVMQITFQYTLACLSAAVLIILVLEMLLQNGGI